MSNALTAPHFQTPEAAREWLEKLRWPEGPVCSHCGTINHAYKTKKPGWYRCAEKECRKDFTVTTGTVMERSHIPLKKWLMAFYLLNASKKGISAHQLHRALKPRLQVGLVHVPSHPRSDAGWRPWPARRRRQDRRGRRNLLRPRRESEGPHQDDKRPPLHQGRQVAPPTSAPSSRWSSAAATSARSMFRLPTKTP